jgi:hypothetical protein
MQRFLSSGPVRWWVCGLLLLLLGLPLRAQSAPVASAARW